MDYDNNNSQDNFEILIKFGYIVIVENNHTIIFEVDEDSDIIDKGLIVGLTQKENIVDAYFLGSEYMKNNNILFNKDHILFNKDHILSDDTKYYYKDLGINLQSNTGYIIDKKDNKILQLSDDAFSMFSSVYGIKDDNDCVLSVFDNKICACCLSGSEVLWVKPIDIGDTIFNADEKILIINDIKYKLSECYLRVCMKHIYLHIDIKTKSKILGKTINPFYNQ